MSDELYQTIIAAHVKTIEYLRRKNEKMDEALTALRAELAKTKTSNSNMKRTLHDQEVMLGVAGDHILRHRGELKQARADLAAARARVAKLETALNEILANGLRLGEFTHKNAFDVLNLHVGIARAALAQPEPPDA